VFDAEVLRRLARVGLQRDESVLAVDPRPVPADVAAEATKVRRRGSHVIAIGKHLTDYDALDTGMFVCTPALFDALECSRGEGDTTLSGGIRRLAARGLMRGAVAGDATWCDIDTMSDLEAAESALGRPAEHA
jgi:choline kinase